MNKKLILLSTLFLFMLIAVTISIGSSNIPIKDIVFIIYNKIFNPNNLENIDQKYVVIVWNLRLPRAVLALLVGASLAVSGSAMQSILKNPLASPYTLGVSAGASLGVAVVIIFNLSIPFLGYFTLTTIGFLSGLITVVAVLAFSRAVDKNFSNQTIILAGVILGLFVSAALTTITALAQDDLKRIILWQLGSFSSRSWQHVLAILPFFIVGVLGTIFYSRELDSLAFGEEQALSLGIEVNKVKRRLILFSAILAGSAVAVSGPIGFVGLVIPHIVRKIFGPRHAVVIPMAIVFGGGFLIITDLIARTVMAPIELPVGAITALIGAPFFALIFFYSRRK